MTESGQILRHKYGISVAESQTVFLLAKHLSAAMSEETSLSLFIRFNGPCMTFF